MTKTTLATALLSIVFFGACAADDHGPKPEANPDESVLDTGKADYLTRNLVSFQGSLELNGSIDSSIDYPDWLHGYTFHAEAGDQISVYMNTDEYGYFFVYGPSHRVANDGTPRFRRSLHGAYTDEASNGYRAGYDLDAQEAGTYLVVYGPAYAWSADYHIELNCTDCLAPGECQADDECAAGEFCGDNGVRCIMAPCTANYDVCQPAGVTGAGCDRDDMCQGFCGWNAANERVCKPWAQEGDSCGGFVFPDARSFCEPGLNCECSEATCDIPGTCVLP